jgi:ABC-2 type transport system permease protein
VSDWAPGALAPRPEAASRTAMWRAQARTELVLLLRNGEQVLLSLVIPVGLLVVLSSLDVVELDRADVARVDWFTPGVIALAVMSTAFTGQAIATGFERHYGVLKRLGATPLARGTLLLAKTTSVLVVELLQLLLIGGVAYALGWDPAGSILSVLVLVALGTAAFSGLGLLLGGTLRGLTCLAVANLAWLLLLVLGGIMFELDAFGPAEPVLRLLPSAALSDGLRATLVDGRLVGSDLLTLAVWAVLALTAAARAFRWE